MTPRGIIKRLDLRRPIYRKTAAYGHFGRNDKDFTWEKLDLVEHAPQGDQVTELTNSTHYTREEHMDQQSRKIQGCAI